MTPLQKELSRLKEVARPRDYSDQWTSLISALEVAVEALDKAEILISHTSLTCMPINVREIDGSISQHRPKSNTGEAYDLIKEAKDKITKLIVKND